MTRSGLPSGTVTFLLTDAEGSTRLWERRPAVAAVVMPRHRDLIGAAVAAWRGACPLEQGEGDSVVAAFALATDAIRAAHAAQLALAGEPWPEGDAVRVRMALHTGQVEVSEDGTYAGPVLNRCARLRALAHGGQVLVSGATDDLVIDHLDDLELVDLGAHRLRDLSRPERVWQLAGPGLEADHPPLRSLDATPNNLPVQLSSFVGRDGDIAQGVRLLGETRLLTFTGAGGCGKTRLAQRVAGEVVDQFPGGTWWVELASLTNGSQVAEMVAAAIGLRLSAERAAVDVVIEHLGELPALLVLDNCEHLVAATAAFADQVLRACASTSVLTTSREPLAVEGEVTWRVPSLSLPPPADVTPAALAQYDAVRLFIDRAVQARPNFRVDNDNAPAVAQICHRLDGIPLAIELAAARVRSLPPERIAAALDDRFRLLSGGSRVAMPRQQTLYASVDWSHELLDGQERALFRRLGVFSGGFALAAAEAVTDSAPLDRYAVLDVLSRLVDKSLVQNDGDGTRYHLLETIRQYALDRLEDAGETATSQDRHLAWVTEFVAVNEDGATNAHVDALDALDGERANIRAALEWATAAARTEDGLRLVGMLGMAWAARGHFTDALVTIPPLLETAAPGTANLASARWADAFIRHQSHDMPGAIAAATAGLQAARASGDDRAAARCLHTLGAVTYMDDPVKGRSLLMESVETARLAGDDWCLAQALQDLAFTFLIQGLHVPALPVLEEVAALVERAGNERHAVWHHVALALVASNSGDLRRAEQLATEALVLVRRLNDPAATVGIAAILGLVLAHHGCMEQLRALAADLTASTKHPGMLATMLLPVITTLADLHDHPGTAGDTLDTMSTAMAAVGVRSWSALLLAHAVFAALDANDLDAALQRATRLEAMEDMVAWRARGSLAHAIAARRTGTDEAEDLAHQALALHLEHQQLLFVPRTLAALGGIALDSGSLAEATRLLAAADTLEADQGRRRSPAEQAGFDADVAFAREALGEAFDTAWQEGAALAWRDAVAYARRARGERKRPAFGWASLTPTEEKVVALVAEGCTNQVIGDRLLIGRETVKTHLGHVYTKLGVRSRTELAASVIERRTTGGSMR